MAWEDVLERVKSFKESQGELQFVVLRQGQTKHFSIKPQLTTNMNRQLQDEKRFTVGIVSSLTFVEAPRTNQVIANPIKALYKGLETSSEWSQMIVISLYRLIKNEISRRHIKSVITIGKMAGESFQIGIIYFLKLMAVISINLFVINLLPIPLLDGGRLMFFVIEAIRGGPVDAKKIEIAQQIGLILLMSLMAYALLNDVTDLFNPF